MIFLLRLLNSGCSWFVTTAYWWIGTVDKPWHIDPKDLCTILETIWYAIYLLPYTVTEDTAVYNLVSFILIYINKKIEKMIDRYHDWWTQIASVALSVITLFLLAAFKTDIERKIFAAKLLCSSRFVYKNGDNFSTEVS